MKILLTGGAGYLGTVLLPKLMMRQHQVRVVDDGYFGFGHLKHMLSEVELIRADLSLLSTQPELEAQLFDGIDVVIHLAAMSNDPSAELDPEMTRQINTDTTLYLANLAKRSRVKFIFSSSCSVYGGREQLVNELGETNPMTTYAISKLDAENGLLALANSEWKPVILRNGTLFGYSSRMRFDLVVNTFSLFSVLKNEIKVFGNGDQWRPLLHVSDCAKAFVYFTEKKHLNHMIYNISHENMTVRQVADVLQSINPSLKVSHIHELEADQRNYHVTNDRMRAEGFHTQLTVKQGAEEIHEAIISGAISDPESILYQNVKWLKQLNLTAPRSHRRKAA